MTYYEQSAWFYDALYTRKDYAEETDYLISVIYQPHHTLLDMDGGYTSG